MKRQPVRSTLEEDLEIQRGIDLDPDNPEWTREESARARPTRVVMPDLVDWYIRTRGKQKKSTKVLVSMRLDSDLVETLRATGRGWQSRANDMLKKAVLGG